MEWHWGNIGSAAAGLAALTAAVFAVSYAIIKRQGPAWLEAVRDREQAQAEAAREQAALAREQAEEIRLERHRHLSGWSGHGVATFGVAAVTGPEEVARACEQLLSGDINNPFVILRLAEGGEGHDATRVLDLQRLVEAEGYISRPPTLGEREALERGLDAMGIPRASFGQVTPLPDAPI